jgi:hypothetical protein
MRCGDRAGATSAGVVVPPHAGASRKRDEPPGFRRSSWGTLASILELMRFGRLGEREGGGGAAGDYLRDLVEVAGADLALVAGRGVAVGFRRELLFLGLGVGRHAALLCTGARVRTCRS